MRNGISTVLGANLLVPPCNIGPLSTPNYPQLVSQALAHNARATGLNVFAGQRAEGFYVDLGALFDLGDLRPFEAARAGSTLTAMTGVNSTDMLNVHSLAIQVPIARLTRSGRTPTGVADPMRSSVYGPPPSGRRCAASTTSPAGTSTWDRTGKYPGSATR